MNRIIHSAKLESDPIVLTRKAPVKVESNYSESRQNDAQLGTEKGEDGKLLQDKPNVDMALNAARSNHPDTQGINSNADYNKMPSESLDAELKKVDMAVEIPADIQYSAAAERTLQENEISERVEVRLREEREALLIEMATAKEEAEAKGYQDGKQIGLETATKEFAMKIDELDSCLDSMSAALKKEILGIEDICLELVFESIAKILGTELNNGEFVTQVVKAIVAKAHESTRLTLHVSNRDHEILQNNKDKIQSVAGGTKIDIVPDGRVMIGGCLVEYDGGTIDGRLELQLQRLKDSLLSVRESSTKGV